MEQLAFGAENGTWRNAYLAGAAELRHGSFGTPTTVGPTSRVPSPSPRSSTASPSASTAPAPGTST